MIGRAGLKTRIDVGVCPRVLNGVIGERLVKIDSIATMLSERQRFDKLRNFSDAILRQFFDSVD